MIEREDCAKLDEVLKETNKLLTVLKRMAELDPRSEEYQQLRELFDQLYEENNEKHHELDKKAEVQKFMEELEIRDFDQERNELLLARAEYELMNKIAGSIKTDPNISEVAKMELAKNSAKNFSKVSNFSDQAQLDRLRAELETQAGIYGLENDQIAAMMRDVNNQELLKDITMGQAPDYMGTTKLGLGTGQRFHGVLGEIKESLQLLRDNLDTDNDKNSHFAKMTDKSARYILESIGLQNQQRNNFNPAPSA